MALRSFSVQVQCLEHHMWKDFGREDLLDPINDSGYVNGIEMDWPIGLDEVLKPFTISGLRRAIRGRHG